MNGARSGGQGGDQDQPGRIRGIRVPVRLVDLLNFGVAAMGDVVSDGFAQRRIDAPDLGSDLVHIEVNVIGGDQVLLFGLLGLPEVGHHHLHQADDATGLLEALVLFELPDQFPKVGVEGVGVCHPGVERLGRRGGQVHANRFPEGLPILGGHLLDLVLGREA